MKMSLLVALCPLVGCQQRFQRSPFFLGAPKAQKNFRTTNLVSVAACVALLLAHANLYAADNLYARAPVPIESTSPDGTTLSIKVLVEDVTGQNLDLDWSVRGPSASAQSTLNAAQTQSSGTFVTPVLAAGMHSIDVAVSNHQTEPVIYSATVVVVDTTPPKVTCPPNVRLAAGPSGQAAIPNLLEAVEATDNSTPESALGLEQNPAPGIRVGLGVHPITVTATDAAGHHQNCIATVTVQDTTAPTVICPPPITVAARLANYKAAIPNVLEGVAALDNCTAEDALILQQKPAPGTLVGLGMHEIVVTATDAAGNRAQSSIVLTVKDTAFAR